MDYISNLTRRELKQLINEIVEKEVARQLEGLMIIKVLSKHRINKEEMFLLHVRVKFMNILQPLQQITGDVAESRKGRTVF